MTSFTKSDYAEWRRSSFTQELFKSITSQAETLAASLLTATTADANRDQYIRGALAGIQFPFTFQPTFLDTPEGDALSEENEDEA